MCGIVTALTLLAVAGQRRFDGPLLLRLGQDHGVHAGDFLPVAFWLGGVVTCLYLGRTPTD